jgi:NAD-dependent dihydropyrimidine dehydrogenase PreA subunit
MSPRGSYRIHVNAKWCKSCNICLSFCPRQVLEMGEERIPHAARIERCTGCRLCEVLCPDLALVVEEVSAPKEPAAASTPPGR